MEKKAVRVAYGEALCKLGAENEKVVVLDADLAAATMTKNQIVEKAMNLVGAAPAESLLIGDSANDAESATQLGIPFIGVTYGYGFKSEADMAEFPHIACVQEPMQLVDFIAR